MLKIGSLCIGLLIGTISFSACVNEEKPSGAFLEMSSNWYTIQNELLPAVSATEEIAEKMVELIKSRYYEDEKYAYFMSDELTYDFYRTLGIARSLSLCGISDNRESMFLQNIKDNLAAVDISGVSLSDVYYFLELCRITETPLSDGVKNGIRKIMLSSIRSDNGLLFFSNESEPIVTSMLYTCRFADYEEELELKDLQWKLTAEAAAEDETFIPYSPQAQVTFYNAGGGYLYAISCFGEVSQEVLDENAEWMQSWDKYYAQIPLTSYFAMLDYSEYLQVKELFGDIGSEREKLENAFREVDPSFFDEIDDLNLISDLLRYISIENNSIIKDKLREKCAAMMEESAFVIGVPSARNTYVAYRLIDLAEEHGMTYAHDKISLYFTEQWLPAAARSEDLSVGAENMTDVLALLRLIDAVADTGRDSTAELSTLLPLEKLESLFPQAMNSASASYFMTISDLCDIETLGFLQTVVPVDTALMRGRFDQMRESGALTLSELAAAYRITKAVRTVAPKDDPTLIDFYRKQIEGRGYRAEQSEILSRDEALSACADIFARMRAGELPVTGDELLMWNTLAFAMNSDEDYEEIGTEEEGRFDAEMERLESEWRELASVLQCEGGLFAATPGGAPSLFYSYAAYFSSLSA